MNDKLKTYATTTMLFSSLLIGSSGAAFAAPGSVEGVVSLAQDNRVKGTVVDDKGEPLIGAVIRIVGADVSFAAVTDISRFLTKTLHWKSRALVTKPCVCLPMAT